MRKKSHTTTNAVKPASKNGFKKSVAHKLKVISLFAGCGGLDLGFTGGFESLGKKYKKHNFDLIWANEVEKDFCRTFKENFKHDIVCADIRDVIDEKKGKLLENPLPKNADIVLGGFPCQDFSLAGKRRGFGNSKRGLLYQSMVEVVRRTRPLIFVGENVRGLMSMDKGQALKTIIKEFTDLGYNVTTKLYLAADYGVPQMRERILIVGTDKKRLPPFVHLEPKLKPSQWVTVKDAIADLEKKKEGEVINHFWSKAKMFKGTQGNTYVNQDKPGPTMRAEHHGNIEWHWNKKRRLSAREAARIQSFPDDFIFYPSTSSAYRQIGNAVPPVFAWHIASAIQQFLKDNLKQKP